MEFEFDDQERFCETPKLPLFSIPLNRACETPGLATPPVNIAGSVPFLWEEAPGKPRDSDENKPPMSNQNTGRGAGVVRCLELPPRLVLPVAKESSPTTVLDGPELSRSLSVIGLNERASEGRFDYSRSTNGRCCDGDTTEIKANAETRGFNEFPRSIRSWYISKPPSRRITSPLHFDLFLAHRSIIFDYTVKVPSWRQRGTCNQHHATVLLLGDLKEIKANAETRGFNEFPRSIRSWYISVSFNPTHKSINLRECLQPDTTLSSSLPSPSAIPRTE